MTRREHIDATIERGDVAELLPLAEGQPCGCRGPREGEPACPCVMTSLQVRNAVSLAALKRGKLVRLTGTGEG